MIMRELLLVWRSGKRKNVTLLTPFFGVKVKMIRGASFSEEKALVVQRFSPPKPLHPTPVPTHTITGIFPPLLQGAGRTIFRSWPGRKKVTVADGTPLMSRGKINQLFM